MNDEELTAIENRLKAITPGPWEFYNRNSDGYMGDDYSIGYDVNGPPWAMRGRFEHAEDAQFVAAAPADIEKLLTEVRRLQERMSRCVDISIGYFMGSDACFLTDEDEVKNV